MQILSDYDLKINEYIFPIPFFTIEMTFLQDEISYLWADKIVIISSFEISKFTDYQRF